MIIKAENLVKSYSGRSVVQGISIDVEQGTVVGLLGPNGAGKTTTFYMIVGFIKASFGNVLIDNDSVTNLPMYERARHGLGYLAQEPTIFRGLSVEENLLAILEP